jgi:alpha-mannosidase
LTIKGRQFLVLDSIPGANRERRRQAELLSFGPVVGFAAGDAGAPSQPSRRGLSQDLPPNVKLVTLGVTSPQYNDNVILRLAHLYEEGEHPTLSRPVNVSLAQVFAADGLRVTNATELSLTGNQTPADIAKARLRWRVAGEATQMPEGFGASSLAGMRPLVTDGLVVELRPMDVRTFAVTLEATTK